MKYEVYADSLFLMNFAMNFYLLFLVDRGRSRRSGAGRLFSGALFGAGCFFLPFVLPGNLLLKAGMGMAVGVVGMILLTFRTKSLRIFLQILEKLLLYAFFLGGLCLFVLRRIPAAEDFLYHTFGVAGLGGAGCLLLLRFVSGRRRPDMCRVTLVRGNNQAKADALIDTGNSLREPISGKPVSIISKEVFGALWQKEEAFRAIPYHSIGKPHGLLQGYLLPGMYIKAGEEEIFCQDVYVAVSANLEGKKTAMLLHPGLLEGRCTGKKSKGEGRAWGNGKSKAGARKHQKQEKRLAKYDIKGNDSGENAV